MLKVRLRDKFSWWKYCLLLCLPFKDLLWRVIRYQGNRYALPNAETGETEMSSHWQFWAGGIYKGSPHKSKEPSFMSKQWTLVRKWDQIFFVLFFRAFLTLPKYNTPCPPFLGHFLLLGRGDHSSSVCVSTSSEKGGSACRCPQYGWKCLSLLVWAFFLHPLLLLSTHADKFTDRVSFLCLGTGSIVVCSGPLFLSAFAFGKWEFVPKSCVKYDAVEACGIRPRRPQRPPLPQE